MSRVFGSFSLAAVLALSLSGLSAIAPEPAHAATGAGVYAEWAFSSNTQAAIAFPGKRGMPEASVSISGGTGSRVSGATIYLNDNTAFGAKYGSSRDTNYASIGLGTSGSVPGTPSVTTITFDDPTPTGEVWSFALGDVDAENITISATDGSGNSIADSVINNWFETTFNYCNAGSPKPSGCPSGTSTDEPTWSTPTLSGRATDTGGATGWFTPIVAVKTLTLTQARNVTGGPSYQLWIATNIPNEPPVIETDPSPQTVTEGSPASFSVFASGTQPISYQWQISTDEGGTWTNIAGATGTTYTISATSVSQSGNLYRATASNGVAPSAESNPARLTVTEALAPPMPPAQIFTLTIDGNGGECTTTQISGEATSWGNLPGADGCTRPDHEFLGFNTSADGAGLNLDPGAAVQFTGNNTVYAMWQEIVPPPTIPPELVEPPGVEDLSPGEAVVVDSGQVVPAVVTPNPPNNTVDVSVNDWTMSIGGFASDGSPAPLNPQGAVVAQPGTTIEVSGTAFAPGTPIVVYALGDSGALGTATVEANGNFTARFLIPEGLSSGPYVIQANGYGPDFSERSTSIALQILNPRRLSIRRTVYFDVLSSQLDATDRRILRRAVKQVPGDAFDITVRSVGFVQPTANRENDASLSRKRAKRTADFIRNQGVQGQYSISGRGRASQMGADARRATVTITYTILR